jgi:septal ring factor EnvC (AmiA/AmiB activator)
MEIKMAKILSVTAQLKQLKDQLAKADSSNVDLEKQLQSSRAANDYTRNLCNEHAATIEQIHQVLDALPNSIARESEGENSWDRVKRSPATRLAAWLVVCNS